MTLSDRLAGRWSPLFQPAVETSLPADASSLAMLLAQPKLSAAGLGDFFPDASALPPPYDPSRESLASSLNPRLSYGRVPGSIAGDPTQAGYPATDLVAKGRGSGPASDIVPASYTGPQSLGEMLQPPDQSAPGYGNLFHPASASDSAPAQDFFSLPSNPLASPVPDDGAYGPVPNVRGGASALSPIPSAKGGEGDQSPYLLLASADDQQPPADDAPARIPLAGYPIQVDPNDPQAFERAYNILNGNIHPTKTESVIRGALQGASFNLGDASYAAAVASGISPLVPGSNLLGAVRLGAEAIAPSIFGHAASDRYDQTVSMERAANALAERENPGTYRGAELVGNLLVDRAIGGVPGLVKRGIQLGRGLMAGGATTGSATATGNQALSVTSAATSPVAAPLGGTAAVDLLSAARRLAAIQSGAGNLAPVAAETAVPIGSTYSVAFQTTLDPASYPGLTRAAHFQEANEALLTAMERDPQFAQAMQLAGVDLDRTATGLAPRRPPPGWTWHHAKDPGVMQLVPRAQHIRGSTFWDTLHPGGIGGYAIWGQQ
ncbi:MAG: HNH endonuclease [Hyphomicrobiales bacterium]